MEATDGHTNFLRVGGSDLPQIAHYLNFKICKGD